MTLAIMHRLHTYNPYREVLSALIWAGASRVINILTSKPVGIASKIDQMRDMLFETKMRFLTFVKKDSFTRYTWILVRDMVDNAPFAILLFVLACYVTGSRPNFYESILSKMLISFSASVFRAEMREPLFDYGRDPLPGEDPFIINWEDCHDMLRLAAHSPAEHFERIPYVFFTQFQKRKCAITGRPIRTVVVINPSQPVYYEKLSLLEWKEKKGHTPPPNWPESIPFANAPLIVDEEETEQITKQLDDALYARRLYSVLSTRHGRFSNKVQRSFSGPPFDYMGGILAFHAAEERKKWNSL